MAEDSGSLDEKFADVTISSEDRGWKREEQEDESTGNKNGGSGGKKEPGGVLGFFKEISEDIGSAFRWGKPEADVSGFHLPSITTKQAEVIISVLITNPNPVPIPLLEMIYSIESDGRDLCSGTIPDAGTVHAHGSETIKIPLTLIYKDIVDTFQDIEPGQVIPYLVKVSLVADVPVFGQVTIPLKKEGTIPIPQKPDVDLDKVVWDHLSFEKTAATLHFSIKNQNHFEIGVKSLAYNLSLANVPIGEASLGQSTTISANDSGLVQLPISFRPMDFGGALWDIVRGRGTGYDMTGNLEVDTPFGPMHLPFNKSSETTLKKKGDDEDKN
ncbi:hypothetical protein CY35_12G101500 [Sphagnum magellanicum]|nr:hypothetical protein CY35_12G101500 [Sphagnum magellanicum]